MHDKSELRRELAARRALAFEGQTAAGASLVAQFPAAIEITASTIIAAYMPFRTEIDPLPLLRALITRGGQGAMPRIHSPSPSWGGVGVGGDRAGALLKRGASVNTPPSPDPFPTHFLLGEGGRGEALTFNLCHPDDISQFISNKWGLLEPRPDLPKVTPNILLVPLLGFDREGNRIGYGKGYYDIAIAALRASTNIIAIGLAFAEQEIDHIPTQPHDQRLDWIVTQNGAYRFPS